VGGEEDPQTGARNVGAVPEVQVDAFIRGGLDRHFHIWCRVDIKMAVEIEGFPGIG
jgi:hypothetical protein